MRTFALLASLLVLAGISGCAKHKDSMHRIDGSIHVTAGQTNGDAATLNGAISIDDKAAFGIADAINGDIWVGAGASGKTARAVDGSITLDKGAHLSGEMTVANGNLTLNEGAEAGSVSNVNGRIVANLGRFGPFILHEHDGAKTYVNLAVVDRGINTVNGDIFVNGPSRIQGGIHVNRLPTGIVQAAHEPPRIVIGPGATVEGTMKFERPVKLYVSDKATIGSVVGASPISFSGDQPPP